MTPTYLPVGVMNRRLLLGAIALLVVLAAYLSLGVKPAQADHVNTPLASRTPSSIDFGNQQIGTNSFTRTIAVRNEHNGCAFRSPFGGGCLIPVGVQISNVALGGSNPGGFTVVGNNCSGATLNQGVACFISVRFNPTVAQLHNATITITSSNSNWVGQLPGLRSTQVSLRGQGVNPTASPDPSSLNFGNQVVATTSAPRSLTVTNTGVGTLLISSASLGGANAGDFVLSSPSFPVSLPQGASTSFSVRFAPTVSGPRSTELVVNSNAAGSPLRVPLAGNGIFNTAPRITAVRPVPNSKTKDRTPTIKATVRDGQTNLAKSNITLRVDGRRIANFRYNQATDKLTYTSRRLSFRKHRVEIVAKDGQGLSARKLWRFTVVR